eukprot:gene6048-10049_t
MNFYSAFSSLYFYIGLICIFVGSIMKYISLGLFSFAHKKNKERAIETQVHYCYDLSWWLIFFIYIFGLLFQYISLNFLKLNFIFSIISIGTGISILFNNSNHQFKKIKNRISYTLSLIFFGILISIIFSNKLIGNNLNFIKDWNSISLIFIIILILLPLILFILNYFIPRIYFASFLSACFSSLTWIGFKIIFDLIQITFKTNDNQFIQIYFYIIILLTMICLIIENYFIQKYLILYHYALFISLYYISLFILNFSGGIILFEEWNNEYLFQQIISTIGMFLILFGIYILSIFFSKDENLIPFFFKQSNLIGHMKLANLDFDDEEEDELELSLNISNIINDDVLNNNNDDVNDDDDDVLNDDILNDDVLNNNVLHNDVNNVEIIDDQSRNFKFSSSSVVNINDKEEKKENI